MIHWIKLKDCERIKRMNTELKIKSGIKTMKDLKTKLNKILRYISWKFINNLISIGFKVETVMNLRIWLRY